MKLGLLTFHTAANFGAALQAYALQEFLESKGYDAEYIDYQSHKRRMIYDMPYRIKTCLKNKKLLDALHYTLGLPFMNRRKAKFEKFNRRYLHISERMYCSSEELKQANDIYDIFIVGSDQVWNPGNNGWDTAFMLDFVKDAEKTISYASSFGLLSVPDKIKDDYAKCLSQIKHLSTREKSGVQIIKQLTGRDAELVLDPVFLLDKEQWKELIPQPSNTDDYLFSYTNRKNQVEDFLKATGFDTKGKKHHKLSRFTSVKDFLNPSVKVKYDMSPTDFLSNVNGAKMVLSASFHCICFSIILNKPFVCFLTGNDGKDERLRTLLEHFGLTNRIYHKGMTAEDITHAIDWDTINKQIGEKKRHSITFLTKSIENS